MTTHEDAQAPDGTHTLSSDTDPHTVELLQGPKRSDAIQDGTPQCDRPQQLTHDHS